MKINIKTRPAWPRKAAILIASISALLLAAWLLRPDNSQSALPQADVSPFALSSEPITPLPDSIPGLDPKKVALGNALFHETRLSHDNTIACATCHRLQQGGIDGRQYPIGIKGQVAETNVPTVFNSAFNFRQFWNGRAATLEDQAAEVILNPLEMGSSWVEVMAKLKQDAGYAASFSQIYDNGITPGNIVDAIATFERTLITPNARFDKYLKGDAQAITAYELAGYKLFKSYGCISCHQGRNIGGNFYEKLGVMRDYFTDGYNITEADQGRYAITKNPEDMHKFKVPSLRNVALTAPYFHNGTVKTLEQAVATMGKYQLGLSLPEEDVASITAFLRTLTGEYNGKPL